MATSSSVRSPTSLLFARRVNGKGKRWNLGRNEARMVMMHAQFSPESESPGSPLFWKRIAKKLIENRVESISCDQLEKEQAAGTLVIDIRPQKDYEKGFIEGTYNIPLYDLIQGWSFKKAAQRVGYAMFGVLEGTELNQSFFDEIEKVVDPDSTVILLCGPGGNINPNIDTSQTFPSRSLIAAYELIHNGYKSIKVLKGGVNRWEQEERDMLMMED